MDSNKLETQKLKNIDITNKDLMLNYMVKEQNLPPWPDKDFFDMADVVITIQDECMTHIQQTLECKMGYDVPSDEFCGFMEKKLRLCTAAHWCEETDENLQLCILGQTDDIFFGDKCEKEEIEHLECGQWFLNIFDNPTIGALLKERYPLNIALLRRSYADCIRLSNNPNECTTLRDELTAAIALIVPLDDLQAAILKDKQHPIYTNAELNLYKKFREYSEIILELVGISRAEINEMSGEQIVDALEYIHAVRSKDRDNVDPYLYTRYTLSSVTEEMVTPTMVALTYIFN